MQAQVDEIEMLEEQVVPPPFPSRADVRYSLAASPIHSVAVAPSRVARVHSPTALQLPSCHVGRQVKAVVSLLQERQRGRANFRRGRSAVAKVG